MDKDNKERLEAMDEDNKEGLEAMDKDSKESLEAVDKGNKEATRKQGLSAVNNRIGGFTDSATSAYDSTDGPFAARNPATVAPPAVVEVAAASPVSCMGRAPLTATTAHLRPLLPPPPRSSVLPVPMAADAAVTPPPPPPPAPPPPPPMEVVAPPAHPSIPSGGAQFSTSNSGSQVDSTAQ
ncbi:WAS/WASL-interacting protein family member 3-like [Schistocerca gregaria]|uniref:WAS/WASL-interacting protein family member 3-like n=1 Tax=Schistocerca gregaria TaxID=7010 RepID=UPI00211F2F96|nr:WAS/WASL-interacting protein family member 3-like [Schistocerca gregaria]